MHTPLPYGLKLPPSGPRSARLFLAKSRRQRRKAYVAERWKIRQDPEGMGIFTTSIVLPGSAQWDESVFQGTTDHASCRFVSQVHAREGWVYHADLNTLFLAALLAFEAEVDEEVDRVLSAAGVSWLEVSLPLQFSRPTLYEPLDEVPRRLAALGNRTLSEVEAEAWARLRDPERWPVVHEGAEFRLNCPAGVDLTLNCRVEAFDLKRVAAEVTRFIDSGEQPCAVPVDLTPWRARLLQEVEANIARCPSRPEGASSEG